MHADGKSTLASVLKWNSGKVNFDRDNDQFWVKTKQLVGRMTAQPHNRFVSCVVIVEFAVNGNATTTTQKESDFKVE